MANLVVNKVITITRYLQRRAVELAHSHSNQSVLDQIIEVPGGGAPEGTTVKSTGETGGTKFLREDGDGTCSWQPAGGSFSGTMDDITDGSTYVKTENNYSDADASKLSDIEAGAEVNVNADWNAESGDAHILNKPDLSSLHNHSNLTILENIEESFTSTLKNKIDGIEDGAEVNNISDTNATDLTDGGATTLHKHSYNDLDNKPTIPIASDAAYGAGWDESTAVPTQGALYNKFESLTSGSVPTAWGKYF